MINLKKILILLFLTSISVGTYAAQPKKKLIASASRYIDEPKQVPLFDGEDEGDEDDSPSNDIYQSWQNEKVNPYKIAIKDLPDSVRVNCSDYYHPITGSITSNFGPRGGRFHYGIDLKLNIGDDVHAAFDGKVRVTGFDRGGYGHYVVIRHDNGLETLYGHLSEIKVVANQNVKAGNVIGLGGNSGHSTGPHLHFEFRYLGNAINPSRIIDFVNFVPYNDTYLISKNSSFNEILSFKGSNHNGKYSSRHDKHGKKHTAKKEKHSKNSKYCSVKKGDTLSGIAQKNGVSVAKLRKLNKMGKNTAIKPKQKIRCS